MGRRPEPGDWVRATRRLPVTVTDHLTDGGLPAGTRGVVVGGRGRYTEVEFRAVLGTARVRVPTDGLRLDRRGGGREAFRNRSRRVTAVRLALAAFLLLPLAHFVGSYTWEHRSLDGLVPAFAVAAVNSAGDWLFTAIDQPVRALVYTGFLAALTRIAFGRRRR
jgi:hypothetical protein